MDLLVVIPTFFTSGDTTRHELALECCRAMVKHKIYGIIVDASPDAAIRQGLEAAGTCAVTEKQYVQVVRQETTETGKAAALRQGIALAAHQLSDKQDAVIAFQEPEKVDMIRHWKTVVEYMNSKTADICAPGRQDDSFRKTYPIEQYHSEQFANLYLNSVGCEKNFPSVDWTMGPIALRVTVAGYWEEYKGKLWDAQLVPMVRAARHGKAVVSLLVDYQHPLVMKQEEEGKPEWSEKRLYQLECLFEHVAGALKEAS